MTSHAALVARGWGKCCIVGCARDRSRRASRSRPRAARSSKKANGSPSTAPRASSTTGSLPLVDIDLENNRVLHRPHGALRQAAHARESAPMPTRPRTPPRPSQFGAEGIGLFRTEHMFYGEGSDKPLFLLRKMILSKTSMNARRRSPSFPVREEGHQGDHGGPQRPAGHDPSPRSPAA